MKRGSWALKQRTRSGISFLKERASAHQLSTVSSRPLIEMFHFWQTGEQNDRSMIEARSICHLHAADTQTSPRGRAGGGACAPLKKLERSSSRRCIYFMGRTVTEMRACVQCSPVCQRCRGQLFGWGIIPVKMFSPISLSEPCSEGTPDGSFLSALRLSQTCWDCDKVCWRGKIVACNDQNAFVGGWWRTIKC